MSTGWIKYKITGKNNESTVRSIYEPAWFFSLKEMVIEHYESWINDGQTYYDLEIVDTNFIPSPNLIEEQLKLIEIELKECQHHKQVLEYQLQHSLNLR